MVTAKELTNRILDLRGLAYLVETYEFIAASAMRRIRNSVIANREFHLGLNRIFRDVKRASEREIKAFAARKRFGFRRALLVIRRPKKSALVFLSANTSLYGDIIGKTASRFLAAVDAGGGDPVVIGRVGRSFVERERPHMKFTYFDFPDTSIDRESLKAVARYLAEFEAVTVYHGQFRSLVVQEPVATSVSGDALESAEGEDREPAKFLFEPSLETILAFFETEIFASLLEQVFHESRLAKLASRMLLLDRASVNIDMALKTLALKRHEFRHRSFNRKQLNALSGIWSWFSA